MKLKDFKIKDFWKKRTGYSLLLAVVLVGIFGWGLSQYRAKSNLNTFVEYSYQRSFYDMIHNVENIDVLLAKGLVSSSPRQNILLFTNVWREAHSAQDKLSHLPIAHELIEKTSKYLNQCGDYSYTIARQIANGTDVTKEQRVKLQTLQKEADFLATELHQLRNNIAANNYTWGELRRQGSSKFREVSPQFSEVSFKKINTQLAETPSFIYDGPFSDHLDQMTPLGLTGSPISSEEALRIAMEKVDLRPDLQYTPSVMETGEGKIPVYRIAIVPTTDQISDQIIVDISRTGGHLVNYLNSRTVGPAVLDGMQAQVKAVEYLKKKGFPELTVTFAQVDDHTATIALAGVQDKVIIYPDQIKVKVALDNGQIIGVSTLSYLMSHQPRKIIKPVVSAEEIRDRVASRLKIESIRSVIIPLETQREAQCWEVKGSWEGEDYYLYYNVQDGNEEKILKVIKTPEGPLTI
ncbi:MAG: germination protein YpeB [Syntrophomonadaceae bacterium]|nr:germination protein YpeB [Syntrophomonadaceae bacterium]